MTARRDENATAADGEDDLRIDLEPAGKAAPTSAGEPADVAGGATPVAGAGAPTAAPKSRGPWKIMWMKLRRDRIALFGAAILIVFYLMAFFAGFLAPYSGSHQFRDTDAKPPMLVFGQIYERAARSRFVCAPAVEKLRARAGGPAGAVVVFRDDDDQEIARGKVAAIEEMEGFGTVIRLDEPLDDPILGPAEPGQQGAPFHLADDPQTIYTVEMEVNLQVRNIRLWSDINFTGDDGGWTRPWVHGWTERRIFGRDGQWLDSVRPDRTKKHFIYFFHEGPEKDAWDLPIVSWLSGHRFRTHLFGVDETGGAFPGVIYPLGSDQYGRCIFTRLVFGAQISLSIGLLGIAVSMTLGLLVGGISGFYSDRTMKLVEMPAILVAVVLFAAPLVTAGDVLVPQAWNASRDEFEAPPELAAAGPLVGEEIAFTRGKNRGFRATIAAFDAASSKVTLRERPPKPMLSGDQLRLVREGESGPKYYVAAGVRYPDYLTKPLVLGALVLVVLVALIGTRSLAFRAYLCWTLLQLFAVYFRYGVLSAPDAPLPSFWVKGTFIATYWLATLPALCWIVWRIERAVAGTDLGRLLLYDKLMTADFLIMRVVEVILAVPGLYLILTLRFSLPLDLDSRTTYFLIIGILSFIGWASNARVIRGMVLSLKEREFILAARALGVSDLVVIVKHILPNTMSYVIVTATLYVPYYILGEVALSFLGIGIQEPDSSWGLMLKDAQHPTKLVENPWLVAPGFFIFAAVLAYNFLGDGLRDAADPRTVLAGKRKAA